MDKEQYILKEVVDNKKLNELMNDVRTDPSEENMVTLLKEAAVSTFIVPLIISDDGKVNVQGMNDSKGKNYMVVYADSKSYEVRSNGAPLYGVTSSFEDLIDAVVNTPSMEGFVINPGLEEVLFGRDMLTMISDMMRGGNDTAKVGEPDHYPPKLREMILEFFKVEPSVNKVWVRLMRVGNAGVLTWLFVLDGDLNEKKDYILDTFKNFIKPYVDGLDLMCASSEEEFAMQVIKGVKPFIERD